MSLHPIFGLRPVGPESPSQAEAEAGTATIKRAWTAQRVEQAIAALSALPRAYLAGLTLSNDTDATNDINITAGKARNATDDGDLVLSSEQTKQIDASWATGDDAGGLSSSLSLTNDVWYHIHLILVSGTVEVGFDTSLTAANLIADHSATKYRRIGSVRRGTATNLGFTQVGDDFLLDNPPLDVDVSNLSTTAVLYTLTVPPGIKVGARINTVVDSAGTAQIYVSSPDADDEVPSLTAAPLRTMAMKAATEEETMGPFTVRTDTSSQIRARASASSTTFRVATLGWLDRRGRDD